jgi:hypothetical protein
MPPTTRSRRLGDAIIENGQAHAAMNLASRRQVGGASNIWGGRCVPCAKVFSIHPRPPTCSPGSAVWEGSVNASVRIALIDRDVPSYFKGLKHLLRYCAGPPFAMELLSAIRDTAGRIAKVHAARCQRRRGVCSDVPRLPRRHPTDLIYHPAWTVPEYPDTPRLTVRAAGGLARSRAAKRLGRSRPDP